MAPPTADRAASPSSAQMPPEERDAELAFVRAVLRDEAAAVAALAENAGEPFLRAVDLTVRTAETGGTVLVSGIGKSGLIGAKIAATLASLGIPAHAVHPTEAAHGDLGRFRKTDLALCLSNSGETEEVVALAAVLREDGLPVIAITGHLDDRQPSTLARLSDVVLPTLVRYEAGADDRNPTGFLAPTSSTTAALAIGDALALAAARRMRFTDEDFARRHPGGKLGGLLRPVTDLLRFRAGVNLPTATPDTPVADALRAASAVGRRPGALLVADPDGRLVGIFTDGDLRRLVLKDPSELSRPLRDVMTRAPRTLPHTARVRDAAALFRQHRQDEVPVVDEHGRAVGLLDVQDLITMKLVED